MTIKRHITTRHLMQAADLRKMGLSWWACGELLDVKGPSLRRAYMRAQDATPRVYGNVSHETCLQGLELRAKGMKWKAIARKLNVNWMTLYKRCRNV